MEKHRELREKSAKSTEELEFTKYVKENLCTKRNEYEAVYGPLDPSYIKKRLEKYEIYTSEQMIREMFLPTNPRSINLRVILGLCKILRTSPNEIFTFPAMGIRDFFNGWDAVPEGTSHAYSELTDEHYTGEFYCYLLKTTYVDDADETFPSISSNEKINVGKLIIEKKPYTVTATMTIDDYTEKFGESKALDPIYLTGTPYLFHKTSNIYIPFMSDHQRLYILAFDYENYARDILYFREGAFLTVNAAKKGTLPLFQKILLFRKKLDLKNDETKQYIHGLLNLNKETLVISKKNYNQLLQQESALLTRFDRTYRSTLEMHTEECYVINETSLLHDNLGMSILDKKKCLLMLRTASYMPSRILIGDDERASSLCKSLQLNERQH